jgi:hypothetical protein
MIRRLGEAILAALDRRTGRQPKRNRRARSRDAACRSAGIAARKLAANMVFGQVTPAMQSGMMPTQARVTSIRASATPPGERVCAAESTAAGPATSCETPRPSRHWEPPYPAYFLLNLVLWLSSLGLLGDLDWVDADHLIVRRSRRFAKAERRLRPPTIGLRNRAARQVTGVTGGSTDLCVGHLLRKRAPRCRSTRCPSVCLSASTATSRAPQ